MIELHVLRYALASDPLAWDGRDEPRRGPRARQFVGDAIGVALLAPRWMITDWSAFAGIHEPKECRLVGIEI